MKRLLIAIFGVCAIGLFALATFGYAMEVDEARVQQKINAKLPFSKPYYVMFRATLDHADVQLTRGKVHIRFDAHLDSLNPILLMNSHTSHPVLPILSGSADITASPEYRSETGQVFLSHVNVVGMNIKGVKDGSPFKPAVKKLALAYLAKHPVYTLHGNNFKKMLARNFLNEVTIRDHALALQFGL